MKIHEYQAKELMGAYGIPVPGGSVAETPEEAREIAKTLGKCVIKAQIHSGGRGKGGGVKVANTPDEAYEIAEKMLGMNLVTHQCPDGKIVHKVLVTDVCSYKKEYYLAVTGDNEHAGLVIVASAEGGTEIEDTAKNHPELIVREPVSVYEGFHGYQGIEVARRLGIPAELRKDFGKLLAGMVKLYLEKDCSLVEINPLVETSEGKLLALDAKVNFDDNALFRHPDVMELRDVLEEDPKEARAKEFDLNYVSLDGNIGCLVNGAGLAMATMDIIRKFGAKPANFLDVGGSATTERVTRAFELLLSDSRVEAIMVNIFGGIMKCDVIAEGIVAAAKTTGLSIPLIVRLEGTNVELGKKILDESGLAIIPASDMADAARKAVAAASEGGAK
ncbi:MAG: ADP-forming succinate--CoA ligase subunit beta [Lachnospiraceae bacterium]|nr:ADP-forming succinate--CoA ligase subunit beta [Lachnospiraceae bacterium]MBQ6542510.1 ADP-forming succinate--CoA ligase subunit beta [Lachnospiraceae bacterium]MBQ7600760.1 ADP-forming succinate--CoA ligase subunit beta [Lachnospiraceae bacterium]